MSVRNEAKAAILEEIVTHWVNAQEQRIRTGNGRSLSYDEIIVAAIGASATLSVALEGVQTWPSA